MVIYLAKYFQPDVYTFFLQKEKRLITSNKQLRSVLLQVALQAIDASVALLFLQTCLCSLA